MMRIEPHTKTVWRMRGYSLLAAAALVVLELTPLPVAALFLVYLAFWRPPWFLNYVTKLYQHP